MREPNDLTPGPPKPSLFRQAKTWIALVLAVYFALLVILNSNSVEVKLVFTTLEMSLSVLLLICGALAFCVGWIMGRTRRLRRIRG